jgi:hypothetical protein
VSPSDLTNEPELADQASPAEARGLPEGAAEAIRSAVHAELVEALRRNNAFDEINDRLRAAERRIAGRQERPLIIGLHRLLDRLRHLDFDQPIKRALEDDIARLLTDAGYQETGEVGEAYDQSRHDAIDGRAVDGKAVVNLVHTRGLSAFGDVVVRAKVEISPGRPAPINDEMTMRR